MPLTANEVKDRILPDLQRKHLSELDWSGLVSAVGALSAGQKAQLLTAIRAQRTFNVGALLLKAVAVKVQADADAEADTLLTDGSLSLADLDRIYG